MDYYTQEKILAAAAKEKTKIVDVLSYHGLVMDDLVYEHSCKKTQDEKTPPTLNDFKRKENHIPVVSFFSGCGGIDLGFEAAGFYHAASIENNEMFCNTLRNNRPHWNIVGPPDETGDISNTDKIISILENVISRNFSGIFVGGPPCQPFSVASYQNSNRIGFKHQKNGGLLFDYVSIIKHFQPAAFLIENVPGLRDMDSGKQLDAVIQDLEKHGYNTICSVLNASDYAIPQHRKRLFVIGTKLNEKFVFPEPFETQYSCGSVLHQCPNTLPNSETRSHNIQTIRRYSRLNYGHRDQKGRVIRLSPARPSNTVIAGGTNGGGRSHLHPEIPRTLCVRECARLQTFPDDWVFSGPVARQFTQAGNAVPPVLAAQLAISIADTIFS